MTVLVLIGDEPSELFERIQDVVSFVLISEEKSNCDVPLGTVRVRVEPLAVSLSVFIFVPCIVAGITS